MRVVGPPVLNAEKMLWVADYPQRGAQRFRSKPAIMDDERTLGYDALERATNAFAAHLKRLGPRDGGRVGYLGKNSALLFPVFFGCLRAGAVFVPLNWRYAAKELGYVLADAELSLLIHAPEFGPIVRQSIASLPKKPRLMETEGASGAADDLLAALAGDHASEPWPQGSEDRCALQLYASGTTGQPKGVMVSHRSLTLARWIEIDSPLLTCSAAVSRSTTA